MAIVYTPEQQKAIELHGCNILVSAAAGSGKTAVLAERIIRMVCDEEKPVDIDRLLVVTFTNAAAAEMRERIAAGIAKRLSEHPESEHLQKQATLLHNAQITTIDSFCLFLLRNHFNEIGLDPAFRIADEGEVRLMQQEVLKELFEDSYASGGERFRSCVEYFCPGGKESVLEQHILNLSRYADSFPWPEQWLAERKEDYSADSVEELCGSSCAVYLMEHLHRMVEGCVEKLSRVRALCEAPDGPYMYGELVEGEVEQLKALLGCDSLEEYGRRLSGVMFGRLPSKKDESVSPSLRELAKNLRAEVKDSVQQLKEGFFATPLELAVRQGAACREPVSTLIDLVCEFNRRMKEKKQEKKTIDFSDLEHYALDILLERTEGGLSITGDEESEIQREDVAGEKPDSLVRSRAVALEYREHFVEILIDEYQDSNLVQEYLLTAVSGEEDGHFNRFMVGDVKQSIYKFRLARPELFLEKYNFYREEGNCQRIDLAKNFRSRGSVVEAVNDVFGRLMSKEVGGILYDERAALYPGAVYPECEAGECELLLIEKPEKEDQIGAKEAEAFAIARKIKELRENFRVLDKESGNLRAAKYSDMVILLRTNSGWDEEFKAVLEKEGIPTYITSKTGYFAATEVQELLQLLRVLDNPCQDIPLFGVMKSIFGGFSEEEIAEIRSCDKDCSLYEALKKFAEESQEISDASEALGDSESPCAQASRACNVADEVKLREKAAAFLQMIADYRSCTVYLPIRELLTKLVEDFGYLDYVTALPTGSKRRANVEMLFTKASDFEKTSYFGLFHFIRYMEQLEKYDVDYGEAELLDENADVVRIMSIHKSKGLEFPITFVAGLSKRFNMQDVNQSLILDMDLGIAVDYVDSERRIRNKTLRRLTLSRKLREDSLAEELRVLYVAMTRAREKLILTGVLEKAAQRWEQLCQMKEIGIGKLSYLEFMEAGSYLDFLLPILPGTCIRVSVIEQTEKIAGEMKEQFQLLRRRELLEQADRRGEMQETVLSGDEEQTDRIEEMRESASSGDGEQALELLKKRLNAVYPYRGLAGLYTKTTVSELKIAAMADRDEGAFHNFEEREVQPYIPIFRREEEKISGTVRGNAYHRVMELLDFELLMKLPLEELGAGVRAFLKREVESGRLNEVYAQAVREDKIIKFLRSELAVRMWRAQQKNCLYREQPFVLGIDAHRLKEDFPDGETVLIQGIIDVFFVEEDGIVLLDYKTDSVRTLSELWNRYETQMDYYQEALQKLMRQPVKQRILYSFSLGDYSSGRSSLSGKADFFPTGK